MIKSYYFYLIIVILATMPYISNHYVLALPVVSVNPTCGPAHPGFNVEINANGFIPNRNVNWKLVNAQNEVKLYGYFQANDNGGFNDVTFMDDLEEDSYKLYFGTDANEDNKFDVGAPKAYANITMPCPTGQAVNPSPSQDWSSTCQTIQKYLINDCTAYVDVSGVLTQEGNRAKDCVLGGGLLSGAGLLSNLPPLAIIGTLEGLSEATNCGGIVDWQSLKADVSGASVFLRILGIG